MTSEQVRKLHKATPFVPFEIHMADGDVLPVPHPEFLWVTPGGRTAWVALGPAESDAAAIVDLPLVTKLTTTGLPSNGSGGGNGHAAPANQ